MKQLDKWLLISPIGDRFIAVPEADFKRITEKVMPVVTSYSQPEVGIFLRKIRVASGMSQEILAKSSGISQTQISKIESGAARAPRKKTIDQLIEKIRGPKKEG